MVISVTLQFDNAASVAAFFASQATPATTAAKVEAPKAEAPKPAPTPTAQPTTTAPAAPASAKAEPATASPSEVNYDQVKSAITKLVSVKGNEAAAAVLESFGVKRGPALVPDQYAAVIAACEAA